MDDQYIERKLKAVGDIKRFAHAVRAQDLARRHGKQLRLPWDAEEAEPQPIQAAEELDPAALEALEGLAGGH